MLAGPAPTAQDGLGAGLVVRVARKRVRRSLAKEIDAVFHGC